MKTLFIIPLVLMPLMSCSDSEEQQKNQSIKKEFPLLKSTSPRILLEEVIFISGHCIEKGTDKKFDFENSEEWIWIRFNQKSNSINATQKLSVNWTDGLPKDRYDRSLPPNKCFFSRAGEETISDKLFEVESVCDRQIYDDELLRENVVIKQHDAICRYSIVNKLNCLPKEHFNEETNKKTSERWLTEHEFEICGSPHIEDYKSQVKLRWQQMIQENNTSKKSQ